MRIVVEQSEFKEKLNLVKKAVTANTVLPILECVYIRADENVRVFATDLNFEISDSLPGAIVEKGDVAVNAKLLSSLISSLPTDGNIVMYDEGEECVIEVGKKKYRLPIIAEKFPFNQTSDFAETVVIEDFAKKVDDVAYAVSANDANSMMTGVFFDFKNGKMVGLDSHRVAIKKINIAGIDEMIVPGKYIKNVGFANAVVSRSKNFVKISENDCIVYIRLLDGKYFNVDQLATTTGDITDITVNREDYLHTLQTLSLFIKESDKIPVIHEISDVMNIYIASRAGKGNDSLEIVKSGNDLKIAFDPRFLIAALSHIDDEEVNIRFYGLKMPAIIEGVDYKHMILPVAIK